VVPEFLFLELPPHLELTYLLLVELVAGTGSVGLAELEVLEENMCPV